MKGLLLILLSIIQLGGHPATLLVPPHAEGERLPAVVVLHDHGAWFTIGKEKMAKPEWRDDLDSLTNIRIRQDSQAWVDRCYSGIYVADSLRQAGFVVLITDAVYWGERADGNPYYRDDEDHHNNLKALNKALQNAQPDFYRRHLAETGEAWFETILREDRESVNFLCSLPYVDTTRIFTFGFSMGAYRSWQLAAADPRIAGCAAANWMTTVTYTSAFITNASSWPMYRPLPENSDSLRYDYPAIAARIAPRPFLLMYGLHDHVLPREGTEQALPVIQARYHETKSDENFLPVALPGDHIFTSEHLNVLLTWLNSQL